MNRVTAVLFFSLLCVVSLPLSVLAAPIPVTVCFPIDGIYYQVMYLPQYYTYNYIQPKVKIVGFVEYPAPTPRGVTLALAQNGTDCYVYIGPANSAIALNVNAVMNSIWMAYSVTATEFSDRVNYPLFNRAVPRVEINQRAITSLMIHFKWTHINILCTDNAYGQAAAAAVANAITSAGGTYMSTCISQYGTYADAAAVVQNALASTSRVLFLSVNTAEAAYTYGVQAINTLDVNRALIVIFVEVICTKRDALWQTVPGALCAVFTPNDDYDAFYASFMTRDTQPEKDVVASISGFTYTSAAANSYAGYNAIAVDGARLIYRALDRYVELNGRLPPSITAAVALVRNQTLPDGFVGPIEIPNGDRLRPTLMRIYNSVPGNRTRIAANYTSLGNLTIAPTLFLLGREYAIADVPPATDAAPAGEAAQPYWVIAVVAAVVFIVGVPAVYVVRQRQLLAVRPMDPATPFAVMFVGVKNIDEVRSASDADVAAALGQVANSLRGAVREHGCFEARRVDESTVMVVAKHVDNTLRCAADLMTSLERVDWSKVMSHPHEHGRAQEESRHPQSGSETRSRQSRQSRQSQTSRHSQLRAQLKSKKKHHVEETTATVESTDVRHSSRHGALFASDSAPHVHVGIHYGFGLIDHDEALNTVSYVGKVVTRAAEVADVAVAGQILVSREAQEAAEGDLAADVSWPSCGNFEKFDAFLTVAPETSVFIPTNASQESIAAMWAAAKHAISTVDEHGAATGNIAAALQRADAGLSLRRIAVVCLNLPLVLDVSSNTANRIPVVAELLDEIAAITAAHRGEIQAMLNGTILITVNAGAPSAQPVARAAMIAVEVLEYLDVQRLTGSAGVAGGLALVGRPAQGTAFATFGHTVGLADMAQRMAAANGLKVCAIDTNTYDDLAARMHVATIDVVPNTTARDGVSRLLAVIGERDATNGEWLYSVGAATAGLVANELAWQQILRAEVPSDDTLRLIETSDEPSAAWRSIVTLSLPNLRSQLTSREKHDSK